MGLQLNFEDIRKRIEIEKNAFRGGSWAKFVGVSPNIVSNIHGKIQQKPSFTYIISVAKATGKSVDYYLWGDESGQSIKVEHADSTTQKIINEHVDIIKKFKDPMVGKDANQWLVELQDSDKDLFKKAIDSIKKLRDAARVLKDIPPGNYSAPSSGSGERPPRMKLKRSKGADKNGTNE